MWCKDCRQDVPAMPSGDKQKFCCPRCGEEVCANADKAGEEAATPSASPQMFATYDGWDLDEQLRHIERVLQTADMADRDSEALNRCEMGRLDRSHAAMPDWHQPGSRRPAKQRKNAGGKLDFVWGALAWLALLSGATIFACGGVLLGWSLVTGRQELWTLGLPLALVGQLALLFGLLLQMERLRRDNRRASAKFDQFDEQLHELKTATTLLSTSQSPASTTFYSHFAEGASPKLLLTDLKSQLDLLAMKIAQEER
jgi:hypothetical protein